MEKLALVIDSDLMIVFSSSNNFASPNTEKHINTNVNKTSNKTLKKLKTCCRTKYLPDKLLTVLALEKC